MQQRAFDVDVDAPPRRLFEGRLAPGLVGLRSGGQHLFRHRRVDARSAEFEVESARRGEDGVPDLLGGQPSHVEAAEQVVAGIRFEGAVGRPRGHPVGPAGHHQSVHRLEAPVPGDELRRQPVEQFRVGRLLTEASEVVRRRRQAAAEVVLPQTVRHDPGSTKVAVVGDPAGQGAPAAGRRGVRRAFSKARIRVAEDEGEAGLDSLGRRMRIAADQHVGRRRLGADLLYSQDLDQVRRSLHNGTFAFRRSEVRRDPVRVVLGRGLVAAADLVGRDAAEERQHAVVVRLRDRVATVVVASGAADRHAEHHPGRHVKDRVQIVVLGERRVRRLVVPDPESQVARGDDRRRGRVVEFVAGELMGQELVIRHVRVERVDHPVAVAPRGGFLAVALVAVRLRVAHEIEPVPSPAFAVVGRCQQAVDQAFPGVGPLVPLEGLDLLERRRQSGQVVARPPDQRPAVGGRRRLEAGRLDLREQEVVDRVERPVRVGDGRDVRPFERPHGPPFPVGVRDLEGVLGRRDLRELVLVAAERGAELHPLADRLEVRVGQPARRRHLQLFVLVADRVEDQAERGLGG